MAGAGPAPLIGVVIPVYGVEDFVEATLESVRAQTHERWECIVVDDGSLDDSAARAARVIDGEPRMRLVRQENRGLSAARNTALSLLTPAVQYVAFLDSDDVWCPSALADLLAGLQSHPSAVGAYGFAELIDTTGALIDPGFHRGRQLDRRRINGWRLEPVPAGAPLTFSEALVVSPLWPPAVGLHRRWAVDEVGHFDTSLQELEDWDFYLRMLRHGDYQPVAVHVAGYRQRAGQMTQRVVEMVSGHDLVRRRTWRSPENTREQRRAATRAWRQLQARRTVRSAQRLLLAIRGRLWSEIGPLTLGTTILAVQNFAAGPPRSSPRQVQWSRRTV